MFFKRFLSLGRGLSNACRGCKMPPPKPRFSADAATRPHGYPRGSMTTHGAPTPMEAGQVKTLAVAAARRVIPQPTPTVPRVCRVSDGRVMILRLRGQLREDWGSQFGRLAVVAVDLPRTRGCLCGKVRCEITKGPAAGVYTCYCPDCQHLTSSAFAIAMAVPRGAFLLMGAEPRALRTTAE